MKALVTGGTGFVGAAVTRELLASGFKVRALTRAGSDTSNLSGLDVEIVHGDLCSGEGVPTAVTGCTVLFHVAADYRLWVPDPDVMFATNVVGTGQLMRAAMAAGVERIVYTSSVSAVGLPADGTPGDETTPVRESDMIGPYKLSKYQAEQVVMQMARDQACPVVTVNPSTPVGPGDIKPTPTGRVIDDAIRGRMPAFVDTGLNIVHVQDVARGHLLALEQGVTGERYILGGDNLSLREMLVEVAQLAGRRPPRIRIPLPLAMVAAVVDETMARISGGTPQVTRDGVRMARKKMYFSSARARRELGYTTRPAAEALADAVAWFSNRI